MWLRQWKKKCKLRLLQTQVNNNLVGNLLLRVVVDIDMYNVFDIMNQVAIEILCESLQ